MIFAAALATTALAALATALTGQTLPSDVAKIGVRVAQQSGQPDATLVDALRKAGGFVHADWL